jgi:hypothetical protein
MPLRTASVSLYGQHQVCEEAVEMDMMEKLNVGDEL